MIYVGFDTEMTVVHLLQVLCSINSAFNLWITLQYSANHLVTVQTLHYLQLHQIANLQWCNYVVKIAKNGRGPKWSYLTNHFDYMGQISDLFIWTAEKACNKMYLVTK